MKIYYARISTATQNEERQILEANKQGAEKIYIDICSGKNLDRPKLKEMLNFIREGDILIVSDISRLARNVKDLLKITEELEKKSVQLVSLKENIDTNTAQGKFMLTVFGAVAELERDYILERQREGIAIAKAEGKYKGRKPLDINMEEMKRVCKRWRAGKITAVEAQKIMGLNPTSFYRKVKDLGL